MTKLSDTQSIILSAAAQRADGNVLPLPGSLRGGAAAKVVGALLARGLIREQVVDSPRKADPAMNTIWRNLRAGRPRRPALHHRRRRDAIGDRARGGALRLQRGHELGRRARRGRAQGRRRGAGRGACEAPGPTAEGGAHGRGRRAARGRPAEGTKQEQLIAMLRRKEGATIAQIVAATGWQPHTVRGAFAGALKKKLGLTVTSEKVEGGSRVYRLPPA